MKHFAKNWQTLIGGLIALAGVVGLLTHRIDVNAAVVIIGTGATWVGVTGKDGNKGSNADAEIADAVVKNAVGPGLPAPPRNITETVTTAESK